MVDRTMPPIELAERLALLLALALFLGFAFEETYKRDEPTIPGGIRTFPLVGLAGLMLYLLQFAIGGGAATWFGLSLYHQSRDLLVGMEENSA
jgi:hypothetical protein